jgi:hypothetical protein
MNLEYIRKTYNVPAKRFGRVIYTGNGKNISGTITGADGGLLRIRLDGDTHSCKFHPTWKITYLAEATK